MQAQCQKTRGAPVVTQSETVVRSLTPEPDGTLRGVQTQTVRSNECGSQGATLRVPAVASRTGDVPPQVTMADPSQAANTTATPVGTSCTDTPVFTMSKSDDGHLIECSPGSRVWSSQHS